MLTQSGMIVVFVPDEKISLGTTLLLRRVLFLRLCESKYGKVTESATETSPFGNERDGTGKPHE